MAGTREGGLKTAETNKRLYGKNYYRRIGQRGGQNGHTGGFYSDRELARRAGRKGGTISRRGPGKPKVERVRRGSPEFRAKISAGQKARWERQRLLNDDWGFLKDISDEAVMDVEMPRRGWRFWRRNG